MSPDNSTYKSRLEKKLQAVDQEIRTLETLRASILQDIFKLKGRCYRCERAGLKACECVPLLSGNSTVEVSRG